MEQRRMGMIHKVLHLMDDRDWLHVTRKEVVRELSRIEDSKSASLRVFEDYIKKSNERLMTVTSKSTDNI